ncbi:hypothetical protein ROZALSC1DRAFT_26687, partial [Rozella allomycis CSF55]
MSKLRSSLFHVRKFSYTAEKNIKCDILSIDNTPEFVLSMIQTEVKPARKCDHIHEWSGSHFTKNDSTRSESNSIHDVAGLIKAIKMSEKQEHQKRFMLKLKSKELINTMTKTPSLIVKVRSFDSNNANTFTEFIKQTSENMGLAVNVVPNRYTVQRWIVLSSPFKYKTARTWLERRVHGNVLHIYNASKENADRMIWYLKLNTPEYTQ